MKKRVVEKVVKFTQVVVNDKVNTWKLIARNGDGGAS